MRVAVRAPGVPNLGEHGVDVLTLTLALALTLALRPIWPLGAPPPAGAVLTVRRQSRSRA